jgi:hypothetical protein
VTKDQRVVAKQDIQEVESAKRAGAPYAHHRKWDLNLPNMCLDYRSGQMGTANHKDMSL